MALKLHLDQKFPESSIWTEIYLVENNESHVKQQSWEIGLFGSC